MRKLAIGKQHSISIDLAAFSLDRNEINSESFV